jgi:hypothetical protein
MKICAIYNVWDDYELLSKSIETILPLVDGVIVVWSQRSNYYEYGPSPIFKEPVIGIQLEPFQSFSVTENERTKRNYGLWEAKDRGFTHFIMMDADEFYDPTEFLNEKKRIEENDILGLVCRVKCYFKSPTLTIGYDTTLVPFIHKITPGLKFEFNKKYPFAWTTLNGVPFTESKQIRIDPTRSMNINSGVEWSDITMHHYSWVRSDIKKKIRNSTARQNIEKSTIVQDYLNACPGYFCEFYGKTLEETPNVFGLPEIHDASI